MFMRFDPCWVVKDCDDADPPGRFLGLVLYTLVGRFRFPNHRLIGWARHGYPSVLWWVGENRQRQKRNAGVSPLRRQSAPPSVEMTASAEENRQRQKQPQVPSTRLWTGSSTPAAKASPSL